MDAAQPTEKSEVADLDVAADRGGLGHDDVVADVAIMRDVAIAHDQAVIADRGDRPAAHGAAMQRCVFTNDVVVADDELGWLALVGEILRGAAEADERKDGVVLAEFSVALDEDVSDELGVLAELYARADDAAGADLDAGREFRALIDDGGRVN